MMKIVKKLHDWWSNNGTKISSGLRRFCRFVERAIVVGLVLNIIASHFWPELPERIPAIYGFFDAWLQIAEFAYKVIFKGIHALFTGQSVEFTNEAILTVKEFFIQLLGWMGSIKF